jgi:hypothetical protein
MDRMDRMDQMDRMDRMDQMDQYIVQKICQQMGVVDLFRCTRTGPPLVTAARQVLENRRVSLGKCPTKHGKALVEAAGEGEMEVLLWLQDCVPNGPQCCERVLNQMFDRAAKKNHVEICLYLYEKYSPETLRLYYVAGRSGRRKMCEMVVSLTCLRGTPQLSYHAEMMLKGATECGHKSLCEYAIGLGANNYLRMVQRAASEGYRSIGQLAVKCSQEKRVMSGSYDPKALRRSVKLTALRKVRPVLPMGNGMVYMENGSYHLV